ncbi:hypothetical protein [uncultured Bacteroides sp.]|uniref:hypothetical protein n=1 Tax=uncultured Bacteroides sp. TaxID=162156 RepID=UPI0025F40006|nr:hypothetical protein [uncultured Bacteroides sp.]
MILKEFLQYIGFCAPIISSMGCGIMLIIYRRTQGKTEESTLYRLLIAYFLTISLMWACAMTYVFFPMLYVRINICFYLGLFWGQVVFYQFVYTLTRVPGEKAFSKIHYIIPLVIVSIFAIWSAFVPFETQVYLVTSRGKTAPGYEAYSRLFTSRLIFRGIWNILYTILAWWRLLAYRRMITDYSANADRSSLSWVQLLLLISFSLVPPSVLSAIFSKQVLISSLLLLIPQLLLVVQHAIVCYNMAVGNFIVINYPEDDITGTQEEKEPEIETEIEPEIDRKIFEKHIYEHRPYLNPDLRITDLMQFFHTNRTYLSRFINREYNMNFSRYINTLRLRELERLRNDSSRSHLPDEELVFLAGFSNYRSYLRVHKMEKERNKEINELQN